MIVYNVARAWFTEKVAAETHRKALGLKPDATLKLSVNSREDLAALLNLLCEPTKANAVDARVGDLLIIEKAALADRAFVEPRKELPLYVPAFLLTDPEQRRRQEERLAAIPLDRLDDELAKD